MSIITAIHKSFSAAKAKNWDAQYWAIDIHGTIIEPNYQLGNIPKVFYPGAKEVLQLLSKRTDIVLILYTCSHPNEIEQYLEFFKQNDINFKYVNENKDVPNADYGYYTDKFYFSVLLEDKAGMDPRCDWFRIKEVLKEY